MFPLDTAINFIHPLCYSNLLLYNTKYNKIEEDIDVI